jgi:excisionase family DNA binding protein
MSERQHAYEFVAAFVKDLESACDIGAESLYGEPTYAPDCAEDIAQWAEVLRLLDPRPSSETGDYYTMVDAAQFKGVSYHTVSRAVRRGKLAVQRIGRQALIARADLEAWRPMVERAPRKYRQRTPDPDVTPLLVGEVRS